MKAFFIIVLSAILMVSPMAIGSNGNQPNGEIQFERTPAFNFTLGNQNITLNFFNPQFLNLNEKKIMGNMASFNSSGFSSNPLNTKNLSFGKAVKESYHENVKGKLNVSYDYFVQEQVLKMNMKGIPLSDQINNFPLSTGYLFINMTINICSVKSNATILTDNGSISIGSNNTLKIIYFMNVHSTMGGSSAIIVPIIFSSESRNIGVQNFTHAIYTDSKTNSKKLFNGINFNIGDHKKVNFLFNDSYMENGELRNVDIKNMGRNGSQLSALALVFNEKGKYSNISYDPYFSIPVKNIFKNVTVKYIENGVISLILENSLFLSAGIVMGVAIIGTGYVYRRKKG